MSTNPTHLEQQNQTEQQNKAPVSSIRTHSGFTLWLDGLRCKLTVHAWRRRTKKSPPPSQLPSGTSACSAREPDWRCLVHDRLLGRVCRGLRCARYLQSCFYHWHERSPFACHNHPPVCSRHHYSVRGYRRAVPGGWLRHTPFPRNFG